MLILKTQVEYLGHIISGEGISVDPKKIEAINNWEPPLTKTSTKPFRTCNYLQENSSKILQR